MKRAAIVFLAVVVLALLLRIAGMTFESLWLDEGYQSMIDAYGQRLPDFFSVPDKGFVFHFENLRSTDDLLRNFRSVDPLCPPLYFLTLNRWISVFGASDIALRMLSVVISMGCLSAVYWFAYVLFGWRAALCASLVQAISPFDIYYAREVRMYSLVTLTGTLSCGFLMMLLFKPPRGWRRLLMWLAYSASVWAMINSHYTGLFVFAFQIVVALAIAIFSGRFKLTGEYVAACIVTAILWIPWFGLFRQAAALRTASFYVARAPSWWWPIFALVVRIPANWVIFLTAKQVVAWAIPAFVTSTVLLVVAVAATIGPGKINRAVAGWSRKAKRHVQPIFAGSVSSGREACAPGAAEERGARNSLFFLWGWAILPSVGLWLIDVVENHRVIEISRYSIGTAPAIYMLVGIGISVLNWRNNGVRLLVVAHVLFSMVQNVSCATWFYQKEPWHKMARLVEEVVPRDEVVLISQFYNITCLDRYLKVPYRQVGITPALGQAHLDGVLSKLDRFTLITAQEGESLTKMIPSKYQVVKRVNMEHALHLRMYEWRK